MAGAHSSPPDCAVTDEVKACGRPSVFKLSVQNVQGTRTIERKYEDFKKLESETAVPPDGRPTLTPRSSVGAMFLASVAAKRRAGLEAFVRSILANAVAAASCPAVAEFLGRSEEDTTGQTETNSEPVAELHSTAVETPVPENVTFRQVCAGGSSHLSSDDMSIKWTDNKDMRRIFGGSSDVVGTRESFPLLEAGEAESLARRKKEKKDKRGKSPRTRKLQSEDDAKKQVPEREGRLPFEFAVTTELGERALPAVAEKVSSGSDRAARAPDRMDCGPPCTTTDAADDTDRSKAAKIAELQLEVQRLKKQVKITKDPTTEPEAGRSPNDFQCPGGHQLKAFQTPDTGYWCDACGSCVPQDAVVHGCRTCVYDVCAECIQSWKASAARSTKENAAKMVLPEDVSAQQMLIEKHALSEIAKKKADLRDAEKKRAIQVEETRRYLAHAFGKGQQLADAKPDRNTPPSPSTPHFSDAPSFGEAGSGAMTPRSRWARRYENSQREAKGASPPSSAKEDREWTAKSNGFASEDGFRSSDAERISKYNFYLNRSLPKRHDAPSSSHESENAAKSIHGPFRDVDEMTESTTLGDLESISRVGISREPTGDKKVPSSSQGWFRGLPDIASHFSCTEPQIIDGNEEKYRRKAYPLASAEPLMNSTWNKSPFADHALSSLTEERLNEYAAPSLTMEALNHERFKATRELNQKILDALHLSDKAAIFNIYQRENPQCLWEAYKDLLDNVLNEEQLMQFEDKWEMVVPEPEFKQLVRNRPALSPAIVRMAKYRRKFATVSSV